MVTLAASILVLIPPCEKLFSGPSAISSISSVISLIMGICTAFLLFLGDSEYKPSISESNIRRSDSHIDATCAANLSLSPYRISSVATVSFSLTMGITQILIVFLKLICNLNIFYDW